MPPERSVDADSADSADSERTAAEYDQTEMPEKPHKSHRRTASADAGSSDDGKSVASSHKPKKRIMWGNGKTKAEKDEEKQREKDLEAQREPDIYDRFPPRKKKLIVAIVAYSAFLGREYGCGPGGPAAACYSFS